MALTYGTEGIKQKDWKVWLRDGSVHATLHGYMKSVNDTIDAKGYGEAFNELAQILANSEHLGECRKDSISWSTENGEVIEGNEAGEIVLSKNCSFTVELINATTENINELMSNFDGSRFFIILEELNGRKKNWETGEAPPNDIVESNDTHEIIVLGAVGGSNISVSESITGGDIPRATITMNDVVPSVGDFRYRFEMPYDIEDNY
ncbi:MAG: hypothetical protein PHR29_05895 [Acholeplasmataceae bacterium]|nr:hypothetical protein [Acholeplasmataceae bacterium]